MNFHLHVSPRRSKSNAPTAMARTPQRYSNPSLSNSNEATKTIGGIREEEQNNKRNTKFLSKI
jgi:diadenosine tetraphosphate (Ap4A) HIT family hydrolase